MTQKVLGGVFSYAGCFGADMSCKKNKAFDLTLRVFKINTIGHILTSAAYLVIKGDM